MSAHPGTVHTYPSRDILDHELEGDDCPCGPTATPIKAETGEMNWHILHHSLDGREAHE